MITVGTRRKLGDIVTDIGKYVLTTVPIAYFVSTNHEVSVGILVGIALSGILFCIAGLAIINTADSLEQKLQSTKGNVHKIKLQKNTIITVEDL